MKLYHGSNTSIERIDLNRSKPYKDFGKGFYLTTIREQALRCLLYTSDAADE